MRGVGQHRGGLEQPSRLRVRAETPSGLAAEPLTQLSQVPPDQDQHLAVGVGDQQRLGKQGPERGPALRPFLGRDHDAVRSVISMTCSGPVSRPSAVRIVAVPPSGTSESRTSSVPSLVTVFTSVSPGMRAASASPSSARNSRNARESSTSSADSSVGPAVPRRRRAAAVSVVSRSASLRRNSRSADLSRTWVGLPRRSYVPVFL